MRKLSENAFIFETCSIQGYTLNISVPQLHETEEKKTFYTSS